MTVEEVSITTVGVILGGLQAYNSYKQGKINKTVNAIHVLTNSSMTEQKRMLAEVTGAKAAITKKPEDEKAASEAMNDYLLQLGKQGNVDLPNK